MLSRRQIQHLAANPYDVIFPSSTGTLRNPSNFQKLRRRTREDFGPTRVTPHTFRKSVGTALANTEGLATEQRQLGHSTEAVMSTHCVGRAKIAPDMTKFSKLLGTL